MSRLGNLAWEAIIAMLSIGAFWGCAGQSAPPPPRPANRYIYVTAQGLPDECYTDLGTVTVNQSFADAAVDQDHTQRARRLRAAALRDYPDDVDAVINVATHQNDVGTELTVTGEAVRLEDHPTAQCMLRGGEKAMDTAALMGAGAIAGATVGGLIGGAGAATAAGIGGASALGTRELLAHQAAQEQQQQDFEKTLRTQREEIKRLLKERARLRQCQEQEVPLQACLTTRSTGASHDEDGSEATGQDTVNASPFEMRKHLQEQQDYIKQLQDEIAQMKWRMGGH